MLSSVCNCGVNNMHISGHICVVRQVLHEWTLGGFSVDHRLSGSCRVSGLSTGPTRWTAGSWVILGRCCSRWCVCERRGQSRSSCRRGPCVCASRSGVSCSWSPESRRTGARSGGTDTRALGHGGHGNWERTGNVWENGGRH